MELLADYYAIVRSMEKLEKAYIGGHIGDDRVYEQVQPSLPSLLPLPSPSPSLSLPSLDSPPAPPRPLTPSTSNLRSARSLSPALPRCGRAYPQRCRCNPQPATHIHLKF